MDNFRKCTRCNYIVVTTNLKFCPLCGQPVHSVGSNPITKFRGVHGFLSNFETLDKIGSGPIHCGHGIGYLSVEAAFQAGKTMNDEDREFISDLLPGEAKREGQDIPLRKDWETIKLSVMENFLWQKFTKPRYYGNLSRTNHRPLIEGNKHGDQFWGVSGGSGYNHLGRLIMKVREGLFG